MRKLRARALRAIASLALTVLAASCGAARPRADMADSRTLRRGTDNIASLAPTRTEEISRPQGQPGSGPGSLPPAPPEPPDGMRARAFSDETFDRLVAEFESLLNTSWQDAIAGGPTSLDRQRLERGLAALSFLKPADDLTFPEAAVDILLDRESGGVESRLLAAVLLGRTGRVAERDILLEELSQEIGSPQSISPGGGAEPDDGAEVLPPDDPPRSLWNGTGRFRIRDLAFATEISGLGSYTARKDARFTKRDQVLLYGEFSGFRERVDVTDGTEERPTFERSFSASLALLDGEGNVIDAAEIITAEQGTMRSPRPRASINFWARYRFPRHLDPGRYRLVVRARDHHGEQDARQEIALEVVPDVR